MNDKLIFSGCLKLAIVGAAAATLCDANHVYTGTLSYPHPFIAGQPWWVFPGFVIAFLGMTFIYRALPSLLQERIVYVESTASGDRCEFVETLSMFMLVYLLSGFGNQDPVLLLVIFYGSFVLRLMFTYERSFMLVLALILGIGGMAGEGLMTMMDLVQYRQPEVFGVPWWLGGVYAHGAFCLRAGMRYFVSGAA